MSSDNLVAPTVFSFRITNPVQSQDGVQPSITSGSDALDTVGVTFIHQLLMDGFIFNVSQVPTLLHKSFSKSSSIRGAATILSVSIETNALVAGNGRIIIGGLQAMDSPSDVNFTVYEEERSGELQFDTTLSNLVLYLDEGANSVDDAYTGQRILLTLATPEAPRWILDIVSYRGRTRAASTRFALPAVANIGADGIVRAHYTVLKTGRRFLNTPWDRQRGVLTLYTRTSAELPESPAQLKIIFEMINSLLATSTLEPTIQIKGALSFAQEPLDDESDAGTQAAAAAAFKVKIISSDSLVLRGLCTISVTLSANALIPACAQASPQSPATNTSAYTAVCARISIRGLTGSLMHSAVLPLSGSEAWMFSTAGSTQPSVAWNREVGYLVLTLRPQVPILAGQLVRLSLTLRNPAQASTIDLQPSIYAVSSAGRSSGQEQGLLIMEEELMEVKGAVMMPSTRAAFTLASIASSSQVLGARSQIRVTIQVNTRLMPPARLLITGLSNAATPDNSALPLEGTAANAFGGAQADACDAAFTDHPASCVSVCPSDSIGAQCSTADNKTLPHSAVGSGNWTQNTGTLILILAAHASFEAGEEIVFSMMLVNPGNTSCLTRVPGNSTLGCVNERSEGRRARMRWEGAIQVPSATVSDSMPWYEATGTVLIALSLPSLAEAAVAWSEQTRGAYNTITLVLRPNFAVVAGTVVRVTGLLGFDSSDVPCTDMHGLQSCIDWRLSLSGTSAHLFAAAPTVWQQTEGTLTLQLAFPADSGGRAEGGLLAGETYEISWTLRNGHGGPQRDGGVQPLIQQDWPFAIPPVPLRHLTLLGPPCQSSGPGTLIKTLIKTEMNDTTFSVHTSNNDTTLGARRRRMLSHSDAGDASPPPLVLADTQCLPLVAVPKLIFSAIHSSSRVMSALTTMTVSLQFNTDLEPAVLITLAGLVQTRTPDDDALPIRVMSPPSVPGSGASLFVGAGGAWDAGVWRREKGKLVLQVAPWTRVLARHMIVLTFVLRNPAAPWVGDTPRFYVSHGMQRRLCLHFCDSAHKAWVRIET